MPEYIIGIIAVAVIFAACPVLFFILYYKKSKEEKRLQEEYCDKPRTRAPKKFKTFFLVCGTILFVGLLAVTIILIIDKEALPAIIATSVLVSLLSFSILLGFLIARFDYEIADGDKIIIARFFKKTCSVEIGSVSCYKYTEGFIGGLIAYDKNGIVLFSSAGYNLNINCIINALSDNSVPQAGVNYPTPDLKAKPIYKRHTKKRNLNLSAYLLLTFGLIFVVFFTLFMPMLRLNEFENYEVNGVISEYEVKHETLTVKLKDDKNIYLVNGIVYEVLDPWFAVNADVGESVKLFIGYTDEEGRLNVSGIEMNGVKYLEVSDAEKAETDNYRTGLIVFWCFIGCGVSSLVGCVPAFIRARNIKLNEEE